MHQKSVLHEGALRLTRLWAIAITAMVRPHLMRRSSRSATTDLKPRSTTLGKWLFALVVPFSGLALGALPVEVLLVAAVLAAVACGLLAVEAETPLTPSVRMCAAVFALLVGYTLLQTIPLPAGVCRVLAPANAAIWERSLAPFREAGPSFHPLTTAPAATRVEVLRGAFYACILFSSLRINALEGGSRFLVRIVVASGIMMALATLAHAATDATSVFGLYTPRETYAYRAGHLSPLLNTNHLAAYLGIGACVALGAVFSKRTMPPILAGVAALVCAATSVSTVSRGATGALVVSGALVLGLMLFLTFRGRWGATKKTASDDDDDDDVDASRSARPRPLGRAPISIASIGLTACIAVSAIVIFLSLSDTAEKLKSDDLSKVGTAKRALELVAASPIFGFGRGSFETVFPSVQSSSVYRTWTHPEDLFVQWFVEWGLPVSVVAFGLVAWSLRPSVVLGASRPMVGAWGAIVGTIIHEVADFHLEVPGVTALVIICIALVVAPAHKQREARRGASNGLRRASFAAAGVTVLAIVLAIPSVGHALGQDRRSLGAKATNVAVPTPAFLAELRAALLRHPAEPFFPLLGALRAQTTREESVLPWIGRALERNEHFGRAHYVLARELASRFPAQARLEYRLAYTYDRDLRAIVVREAMPLVTDADSALEIVPDGAEGIELLEALVNDLGPRMPSTAHILDAELERRDPMGRGPMRRRVESRVLDVVTDAPWCNTTRCFDEAMVAADELVKREPDQCDGHFLVARLRMKRGDTKIALDTLQEATPQLVDRGVCERRVIELAQQMGDVRRVDFLVDRLVKSGCGAAHECVELHVWAAGIELQREHWARAVRLYRRVLDVAPERDDLLERIGELGEKPGVRADALDAYRTLALRHPDDTRWPARINALTTHGLPTPAPPPLPSSRAMGKP